MNAFFHAPYGAARPYLFSKVFLLLLALDTWMLMIGHAGRYGIAGFNVAHFGWLDALQPIPSAAFYIAVLVLTGLLACFIVLTGTRTIPLLLLFLLYTFSWAMSMLDSYQHHYLVSVMLFGMVFFPQAPATVIHPLLPEAESERQKRKLKSAQERLANAELAGFAYAGFVALASTAYLLIEAPEHPWVAFFLFASAVALATWMYSPKSALPCLTSGWGFPLLGTSIAIVYFYTAFAKLDENWLAGHTILQIGAAEREFAGLAEYAARWGIERERFWSLFATFVIPQEFLVGAAYLFAVHQDRLESRALRALCLLAFGLALALHVGAEAMQLEIGWFSYYMLLAACCFLLPLTVVDRLATTFTWPARWLSRQAQAWQGQGAPQVASCMFVALASGGVLVMAGYLIDLPGAVAACALAAIALLGVTLAMLFGPQRSDPRTHAVSLALAAAGMWIAIAVSPVRWDFYRYTGGDLSRRGELKPALEIYRRGERYAPEGQSRMSKIRDIEQRLREQGESTR